MVPGARSSLTTGHATQGAHKRIPYPVPIALALCLKHCTGHSENVCNKQRSWQRGHVPQNKRVQLLCTELSRNHRARQGRSSTMWSLWAVLRQHPLRLTKNPKRRRVALVSSVKGRAKKVRRDAIRVPHFTPCRCVQPEISLWDRFTKMPVWLVYQYLWKTNRSIVCVCPKHHLMRTVSGYNSSAQYSSIISSHCF